MIAPDPKRRWLHPTPGKLLVVLLAAEGILLLSERWMPKGWAVLIAVAAVGLFLIVMLLWFVLALVFHRRFQFSLRSLLVLTVAVAVPCSWMAAEMRDARKQREVVEEIRKLGGDVEDDCQKENDPEVVLYSGVTGRYRVINAQSPTPEWLRKMMGGQFFATVIKVYLLNSPVVTDTDMEKLKTLNQLKYVDVRNTQVTDKGVRKLQQALPNCVIDH
jgi:hypothetical protein